jgi:hypothetical protein
MSLEAAMGNVTGFTKFHKFGRNSDIDTAAGEDIWNGGLVYTGFPTTAAETMEIFSSSVNDTAAGTGARTITIYNLLDSTSAESPNITVTLNGTTPVSLGALTYYRGGSRLRIITAGSGGGNAGTITLRHTTTTANIFAVMPIGYNQTAIAAYTVPLGKTLWINSVIMQMSRSLGAPGSASMTLRARKDGEVFNSVLSPEISDGASYRSGGSDWLEFTEKTDVKITCESVSDNNTIVNGEFGGFLVKD